MDYKGRPLQVFDPFFVYSKGDKKIYIEVRMRIAREGEGEGNNIYREGYPVHLISSEASDLSWVRGWMDWLLICEQKYNFSERIFGNPSAILVNPLLAVIRIAEYI